MKNQDKTPSLADVVGLRDHPPAHLVSLADSVVVAMSIHQLAVEAVQAYSSEVLNGMQAKIDRKWVDLGLDDKLILNPKDAFLLSPGDAKVYYERCDIERQKRNMSIKEPGNCPALEAETLEREATKAFLEAMVPVTGITYDQAWTSGQIAKLRDWGLNLLSTHLNPHARFNIPEPSVSA